MHFENKAQRWSCELFFSFVNTKHWACTVWTTCLCSCMSHAVTVHKPLMVCDSKLCWSECQPDVGERMNMRSRCPLSSLISHRLMIATSGRIRRDHTTALAAGCQKSSGITLDIQTPHQPASHSHIYLFLTIIFFGIRYCFVAFKRLVFKELHLDWKYKYYIYMFLHCHFYVKCKIKFHSWVYD